MVTKFSGFVHKSRAFPDITSPAPPPSRYYNAAGVLQSSFASGGSLTSHTRSESIMYTNHVKGEPYRDNRCMHTRAQFDYSGDPQSFKKILDLRPGFEGCYYEYYGGHSQAVSAHPIAVSTALAALGVSTGTSLLDGAGQGYVNDAFSRAQPDLTTVSVPNFLLELEDVRSLFRLWKSNVGLGRNLAGARLNYSFGWKPTIGDVSAMINCVRSLEQKLKRFRESIGHVFSKTYTMSKVSSNESGAFNYGDIHHRIDWTASVTGVVKVHLKYRYAELALMTSTERTLRGLLDTLGFELNPRIIWDAIPFTFVIDWFFGVGAWLQNFKIDTLELPVQCLDASVSYKEILKVESRLTLDPSGYPTDTTSINVQPGCVSTTVLFDRRPLLPDYATLSGLGWRTPSFNQLVNLISLAAVLTG